MNGHRSLTAHRCALFAAIVTVVRSRVRGPCDWCPLLVLHNGLMRYVIVGAGAIGATIGGLLADAGREVVLVARGDHLLALKTEGLRLTLPERLIHLRLPAVAVDELALRDDDVLVLTVKSQQSEAVLTQLAALPVGQHSAGEALPVLCAQNGISNEDTALRFFAGVHGVCVNLPATHLEPGLVEAQGMPFSGVLQVGRFPRGVDTIDVSVVADLCASGFVATAAEDVMAWKRAKLLRNVGNALEVLCAGHLEKQDPQDPADSLVRVIDGATQEARACFAAAGWSVVTDRDYSAVLGDQARPVPVGGHPRQGGSTWQSVQRGQGSVETDFLNGEIVRLGRLHQIPTPLNSTIQLRMRTCHPNDFQTQSLDPIELLG